MSRSISGQIIITAAVAILGLAAVLLLLLAPKVSDPASASGTAALPATPTPRPGVQAASPSPTQTRAPTPVPPAPTATLDPPRPSSTPLLPAVPTLTPSPMPTPAKKIVRGQVFDAYINAAVKAHQEYPDSCEFDAAWVVLKTYGFDVGVDKQASIVGVDKSIEPYFVQTQNGYIIYGGDITSHYSGDYKHNFLARATGSAMRKVFEYYGLRVTPVHDRASLQSALLRGDLVWIKTTVDFKSWRPATWIMPDGRTYKTVLGNDHAVVVIGFNSQVVAIRDVLGPTSTNWNRVYEYDVPWDKFLASWGAQSYDGLAVAPPWK